VGGGRWLRVVEGGIGVSWGLVLGRARWDTTSSSAASPHGGRTCCVVSLVSLLIDMQACTENRGKFALGGAVFEESEHWLCYGSSRASRSRIFGSMELAGETPG
jgi:hypothetical protein